MPFTHTTRRGKIYYLHTGPKRGGGVQHFFSTDPRGPLAEVVPEGFEIHETINAQVYLRRKTPTSIREAELSCVQRELAKVRGPKLYAAEVDREKIVIHESTTDIDFLGSFAGLRPGIDLAALNRQFTSYQPLMRFALQDKTRRLFYPERYCWRGRVDDWISIGEPDEIEPLVATFIPHLGRDSFYNLSR